MQLLSGATVRSVRELEPVGAETCAAAVLDGVPQVMWFVRRHMRRNRGKGLSVPQFRTLILLENTPGATLSLVADHLGLSLPTASRLVGGLVRKGLISRQVCRHNRRRVSLSLTQRGRTAHEQARKETQHQVATKLAGLPADDRRVVMQAMTLLGELFSNSPETAEARPGATCDSG